MMTDRYEGYCGEAGTRNPEEPASAAYLPIGDSIGDCDAYNRAIAEDAAANDDENPFTGRTNDGTGVMTTDYAMVNQASIWGPTKLDPFPPGVPKEDILALLAYNWRDEEVDYYNVLVAQDITADELNKTHIFAAMNRINDWINRVG
jgi:hypothetical protein